MHACTAHSESIQVGYFFICMGCFISGCSFVANSLCLPFIVSPDDDDYDDGQ